MPLKSLKPSMRENKRYLLVEGKNLEKNMERAILEFIGTLGMSRSGFGIVKKHGNSLVVSVNRESLDHVRASFAAFPEKISVKKVSGTLKGLGRK